jgi:hypothetical protein
MAFGYAAARERSGHSQSYITRVVFTSTPRLSITRRNTADFATGPLSRDFGAEIRVRSDFTLSRGSHAIRRDTGMPRPVMMLMTLQATLASVFCVGRVRA